MVANGTQVVLYGHQVIQLQDVLFTILEDGQCIAEQYLQQSSKNTSMLSQCLVTPSIKYQTTASGLTN